MYLSNFWKFPTFSMCSNRLVINQTNQNKQNGANEGQLKLTICDEYWKWNKFDVGVENDGGGAKKYE